MEKNLINIYPFWLERSIKVIKSKQLKELKKSGIDITIEQWVILLGIENLRSATQKEISEKTYKDTANVNRIINQLIKKGLANKEAHSEDGRKSVVTLTETGLTTIEKALPIMDKVRNEGLADIGEKEFDYMMMALKKIYHSLA